MTGWHASMPKNPFVTFLDIRDVFLDAKGKVREELFCDPAVVVINGKKASPCTPTRKGSASWRKPFSQP